MSTGQEAQGKAGATTTTTQGSALERMLGVVDALRPKTDEAKREIQESVTTLFEHILGDYENISKETPEVLDKIERVIAEIDRRLTSQLNIILHHSDFQKLEGSWRGLAHLVNGTETSDQLKIKVFNISKKEIYKQLKGKDRAGWDQTEIFKKIYEEEYGTPGGQPFGVLIGDYEFGHTGPDVQVLRGMSKIASTAHAPFLAAASSELLGMESWTELPNPRDLRKVQDSVEHAAWRSLREDEDSRYLGLAMPRYLSRVPYGSKTEPVESFDFEEDTDGSDHTKYTWSNAAYAMGANINRAFYENGWTTQIRGLESGGIVENLPSHVFPTDDGGIDTKCPTEIAITDRREKELADIGLMPLSHYKNSDYACFFGAQSLKKPAKYLDDDAQSNENLSCRLPYLFSTCRFAHYLKCMVRDKIGSFMEADELQKWLTTWIMAYVLKGGGDESLKAKKPLADARVEVKPVEGDPGNYRAVFYLRPHFQLEGLTASLRLVSNLKQKAN
ncbi:MAG: type secretion protein EvpB/VC family [Akkermansiaceae bacterium]|nr:type secretion protein EvpB/VC family [Akkermansiaceae bacterium]